MNNELLRQLQATTAQIPVVRFKVVVVAFGMVFEGTTVSHMKFKEMLGGTVSGAFPSVTDSHNRIPRARDKAVRVSERSFGEVDDDLLYLADVMIDSRVHCKQICVPFREIDTWSLVEGIPIIAAELTEIGL